jgi:PrcB C-terminal
VLALVAVAVALAVGVSLHAYGHTGSTPVAWKDVSDRVPSLDRSVAAFKVNKFDGRERILISPGPRSSTGYAVRIVSVTEQRRQILVEVREVTPHLGQRVQARVTYPYKLIEIPRTRKHVTIHWLGH